MRSKLRALTIALLLAAASMLAISYYDLRGTGGHPAHAPSVETSAAHSSCYALTSTVTELVTRTITVASPTTKTVTVTELVTETATVTEVLMETITTTATRTVTITRTAPATARRACVELLSMREYYEKALALIERANKSIELLMFLAKYDPDDSFDWANDLLLALCRAARRGVKVRVVLDECTKEKYPQTIELLKDYGVEVRVWTGRGTLHAKLLLVDDEHLLVGSHNWTESGLYYNVEATLYTNSTEAIEEAKELFEWVWSRATAT